MITNRACTDAHWAAKHSRNSGTGSRLSPYQPVPLPQNVKQRTSDDDPPVRKATQAESPVVSTSHHRPVPRQSSRRKGTMPRS